MAADVLNNWIGYLDRSYSQIKASVLSRVITENPEMTDHSESNPFVILLSTFAAMTELLGYYQDNIAQESFLGVAQRTSSAIKHTFILDYRILARSPESVDITITWTNGSGVPTVTPSPFTLQEGSSVETTDGIIFRTIQDYSIGAGLATSIVSVSEITQNTDQVLGTTDATENQSISLGSNYVHNSASIEINSIPYDIQETFANSSPTDTHFIVEIREDGNAYIVLGNDINGIIPPNGFDILVTYKVTTGPDGRAQAGSLVQNVTLLGLPPDTDGTTNNLLNSSGGSLYEDIEKIRDNAPKSIRTLSRMVTWEDHEDIISNVAGVGQAKVNFCCGKDIDIYIVPTGGGIASGSLVSLAQAEAELKKMVATFPVVQAAGETRLIIAANVTTKPRKGITETKNAVEAALVDFGQESNQRINGSIRLSDIQALIDNLPEVDYVDITSLYTIPYARILAGTNPLVWTTLTLSTSSSTVKYKLVYNSGGPDISFFIENQFTATIPLDSDYVVPDGTFRFNVDSGGAYTNGDSWEFKVYPFLQNIFLNDFTLPTIQQSDLGITIFQGNDLSARNPVC